ncbi:MAG: LysR substrate-binding domain-containing protein [Cellvibrionaceae bacterium]
MKASPHFKGLYYFYVAAEHLSIKKAAEYLFVTQAAVSQQIRLLEDAVGVPLFSRHHRSIALTPAGQKLLPALKTGFERIQRGVDGLFDDNDPHAITVTVIPSFASRWLIPRLGDFYAQYPEMKVMLQTTDALESFVDSSVDLAIRFGRGDYPELQVDDLMDDFCYPVCHPLYQSKVNIQTKDDLARCQLLVDSGPDVTWERWFELEGIKVERPSYSMAYDASHYIVEGLLAGQGVGLVRHSLVAELIASGSLVRLFERTLKLDYRYYLCAPEHYFHRPKVKNFTQWLRSEVGKFNADHVL